MKKILQLAFLALTLTPFATASFYEGFDGNTFPSGWEYWQEYGGPVKWTMGGGVAKATQIVNNNALLFNYYEHDGGDFVFQVRAGWDESDSTALSFGLGHPLGNFARMSSYILAGRRRVDAVIYNGQYGGTIFDPAPGWHDWEIAQKSGTLSFRFDGKEFLTVPNYRPYIGFIQFTLLNKDSQPFPPMYIDRIALVPEPTTSGALAISAALLVRRRKARLVRRIT